MSNDADLEYGPTPPGAEYEHTDIDPGIGYRFGIWLAVSMVIGAAIVYGLACAAIGLIGFGWLLRVDLPSSPIERAFFSLVR